MNLSPEALLMMLALGLYLYDSMLLLNFNELVMEQRSAARWAPCFGSNRWRLARREPLLLNPLTPWRLLQRRRWSLYGGLPAVSLDSGPMQTMPGPLPGTAATVLLGLMFVGLPLSFFVLPLTVLKLVTVFAIYAAVFLTMALIHRERGALQLDRAAFWKLCLECVSCPPFCINAPRRLYLSSTYPLQLASFAGDDLRAVKAGMAARVREQLASVAEASSEEQQLQHFLRELETGAGE